MICCFYSHLVKTNVILCSCLGKSLERFFVCSRFHRFDKSGGLVGAASDSFSSAFAVQSSHRSFISQRKLSLVAIVSELKRKLDERILKFKLKFRIQIFSLRVSQPVNKYAFLTGSELKNYLPGETPHDLIKRLPKVPGAPWYFPKGRMCISTSSAIPLA